MAAPTVPTLEIEDPSGRRVVVAPTSGDDRLGELADALGLDPGAPLQVDGRAAARCDSLTRAGVRRGSRLDAAGRLRELADEASVAVTGVAVVTVVGEGGPDTGTATPLAPGRHVVGRAVTARIVVADRSLEPHHALLEVAPDGTAELVQVAGRVPCRVDGLVVSGRVGVPDGAVVVLGASRLRLTRAVAPPAGGAALGIVAGDPWRQVLRRAPRVGPAVGPRADPDPDGRLASAPPERDRHAGRPLHVRWHRGRRRPAALPAVPRVRRRVVPGDRRDVARSARSAPHAMVGGGGRPATGMSPGSRSPWSANARPGGATTSPRRRASPRRSARRPRGAVTCGRGGPDTATSTA